MGAIATVNWQIGGGINDEAISSLSRGCKGTRLRALGLLMVRPAVRAQARRDTAHPLHSLPQHRSRRPSSRVGKGA